MKDKIFKRLVTFVCCILLIICSYNNGFNAGKKQGDIRVVYQEVPKVEIKPLLEFKKAEKVENPQPSEIPEEIEPTPAPIEKSEKVEITPTATPKEEPTPKPTAEPTPQPTKEPTPETQETGLVSLGTFTTTAYCSCSRCCGKSDGITATGTVATAGRTIAVDPSIIPYGTEVIINGNTYIAEDRGGGVNGNHIDIFCSSHSSALQYGRQSVEVFVRR